ncbi:NAD(P)H-dependent flavin oxidoreductase [Brevibacillus fulvus]|uniref:Probable nitronate monooxygenase n=1 Tax=Brevibacillus fulvus TaxID=1125967 RepID=A0A939BQH4_9BACL|nr:nitronate monooxygenase [Brevibacillus fulvus]MBM7591630.1 nitronate monooxygenase [Brevibacillus fulvus]
MTRFSTRFTEKFGIEVPIVLAGMAGNITSPQLVAAVSEAGGLGTLGAAYMKPEALRQAIRQIKQLTNKPFAVNLLIAGPGGEATVSLELIEWINQLRESVGLTAWSGELPHFADDVPQCFEIIVEEKVPVFSFAFSASEQYAQAARDAGMKVIGMATTLEEARTLRQIGVDAIVAQGGEAGGHRGTFGIEAAGEGQCIGTLPLVSLLTEQLPDLPIVAAGGMMNGQALVAALALGADAIQLGTRFLACRESTAHPAYKQRLLDAGETDTVLTRAFSGRPARGLRNQLINSAIQQQLQTLPYPLQNQLTREIRSAAAEQGNSELMSLWAGQGVAMLKKEETAAAIMAKLLEEAGQAAARIKAIW